MYVYRHINILDKESQQRSVQARTIGKRKQFLRRTQIIVVVVVIVAGWEQIAFHQNNNSMFITHSK